MASQALGRMFLHRARTASCTTLRLPQCPPRSVVGPMPMWLSRVVPRSFSSYPPHQVVGLPKLSPTMESGSINAWKLTAGDSFAAGDIICVVDTDKASIDYEVTDDGFLAKILAQPGTELKLGDPIMVIVEDAEHVKAFANFTVDGASTTTDAASAAPPTPTVAEPQTQSKVESSAPASVVTGNTSDRVFASPRARMVAKELKYPIEQIAGTGYGGRIVEADVREYKPPVVETPVATPIATPAPAALAAPIPISPIATGSGFTDYPLSPQAQEVAARLQQSKRNVPHYYLTVDVNLDELLEKREKLNKTLHKDDPPLGVYEFLLKAVAAAMKTVPTANASWMDTHVRVYDHVDINVVVGSGDSLYTPVIRNVASKGLKAISNELRSFTDEPGKSELGTFTVVNLGMYGIQSCATIIPEPQSCALAFGALENRIIPNDDDDDDEDIYREAVMMTATLSCDHRVVDGAVGAQWLAAFKALVENPDSLLL